MCYQGQSFSDKQVDSNIVFFFFIINRKLYFNAENISYLYLECFVYNCSALWSSVETGM